MYEIFEDVTQRLNNYPTITLTKSYIPSSVNIFINGLLQTHDSFVEADPLHGNIYVTNDTFSTSPNSDHNLVVSYNTEEIVYVDPYAPVHISKLKGGDVVRVAMKAGMHLNPVPVRKGEQLKYESQKYRHSAKNHSITVTLGWVANNDPVHGILHLQIDNHSYTSGIICNAILQYAHIKIIQKYVTPSKRDVKNIQTSSAHNAYRRPGALAKGVLDAKGFMHLVQVFK